MNSTGGATDLLNECHYLHPSRFRQIPTFGRSTIRRFHRNVSDMKKMAGRDFEDILQVNSILFMLVLD
jgi:hypothetical protein